MAPTERLLSRTTSSMDVAWYPWRAKQAWAAARIWARRCCSWAGEILGTWGHNLRRDAPSIENERSFCALYARGGWQCKRPLGERVGRVLALRRLRRRQGCTPTPAKTLTQRS